MSDVAVAPSEIVFDNGDTRLAGTAWLTTRRAEGGLVFVAGSGPSDRDWWDWPDLFGRVGIGSLAHDKPRQWTSQSLEDRAVETLAAAAALAGVANVDRSRVGLLGMSQGGWVAPLAATLSNDVAFVVCLSSAGVTPADQEAYRIERHLPAEGFSPEDVARALEVFFNRIALMRAGANLDEVWQAEEAFQSEPWFPLVGGTTKDELGFLLGIYDFDPVPVLRRVRCPLLAVWGDADIFVPVERSVDAFAESLREAENPAVDLRVLPNANHYLFRADVPHVPGAPVFPERFLDDLVTWVRQALS